jgi:hypothetical protein
MARTGSLARWQAAQTAGPAGMWSAGLPAAHTVGRIVEHTVNLAPHTVERTEGLAVSIGAARIGTQQVEAHMAKTPRAPAAMAGALRLGSAASERPAAECKQPTADCRASAQCTNWRRNSHRSGRFQSCSLPLLSPRRREAPTQKCNAIGARQNIAYLHSRSTTLRAVGPC